MHPYPAAEFSDDCQRVAVKDWQFLSSTCVAAVQRACNEEDVGWCEKNSGTENNN